MATYAARRLLRHGGQRGPSSGIELLAAAQGSDFHAPMRSSDALERARACLRAEVPTLEDDRYFAPDMAIATGLVDSGRLVAAIGADLPGCVAGIA